MNDVRFEDVAIPLEPIDRGLHHLTRLVRIVDSRASVMRLNSHAEVREQHHPVVIDVFVQRFDRRVRATTVVLGKRHVHPTHARRLQPSSVVDVLTRVNHLLSTWQRPIDLAIAHRAFVSAVQEMVVRLIDVNACRTQPMIEPIVLPPLCPARIIFALLQRRTWSDINVARIRTIIFELREPRAGIEIANGLNPLLSPFRC